MKAEQRKQLEKNELASHLNRLFKGAGDAKSSSTLWIVIGAIALTGALILAWRYYADSSQKNRASLWRQFEQAGNTNELEGIIESNRGTTIAVAAKAQLARIVMTEGLATLGDPSKRAAAIASVERARELYEQVAKEAKDDLVDRKSVV